MTWKESFCIHMKMHVLILCLGRVGYFIGLFVIGVTVNTNVKLSSCWVWFVRSCVQWNANCSVKSAHLLYFYISFFLNEVLYCQWCEMLSDITINKIYRIENMHLNHSVWGIYVYMSSVQVHSNKISLGIICRHFVILFLWHYLEITVL